MGSLAYTIYIPEIGTHSFTHLIWENFSICTFCRSYNQSLQCSFLVPPATHHCWVDRGAWNEKFDQHMTSSGNQAPDLLILSLTHPLGHMLPYICESGLKASVISWANTSFEIKIR